ncbi:MAG: MFS transporter [Actinomycetota bacterium]|nr:MFS transporter [Actinomycetota bacterium]
MGRALMHWDPEDTQLWENEGRGIARRNLSWSIFAEFLGFSVWQLWSVVAVKLNDVGFSLSTGQLFWLVSIPGLVGATARFPYTFAPARFGGRAWTVVSALLLLIPTGLLAWMVSEPTTPYWALLLAAATAGLGGGNFASSMANIAYFYPERSKGAALGLNAAGGNIGVAVVQKVVPLVIAVGAGAALHLEYAGLVYVPFILLAAWGAWRYMNTIPGMRSTFADQVCVVRHRQTWLLTLLYTGAFGSFIGYSAAMPLLIKGEFPGYDPLAYAFLGPLVGSLARPFGGWLSDRVGGARVTVGVFAAMSLMIPGVIAALHAASFGLFLGCFLVLFVLSGMANGSTFRIVPQVFAAMHPHDRPRALRETSAVLGISSAVAAYGSFVIPQAFKESIEGSGGPEVALYAFLAYYVVCLAITAVAYLRPQVEAPAAGPAAMPVA